MINGKNFSLIYPDKTIALNNINLNISSGDLIFLTGDSGSGKTSMLKLLIGSEFVTEGELIVLGCGLHNRNNKEIRKMRRLIGPIFQEFRLVKGRTSLENVLMSIRFLEFNYKNIKEEAINLLANIGLQEKIYTKVENLSWGETQRVAIARAVIRKPRLILADEPTGNLDRDNAIKILDLLSSFRDDNTSVIITTHATHLINNYKDAKYHKLEGGCLI